MYGLYLKKKKKALLIFANMFLIQLKVTYFLKNTVKF